MTPRGYMILGALFGGFAVFMTAIATPYPSFGAMALAGGMLFGRGYGIWEERSRRAPVENKDSGE